MKTEWKKLFKAWATVFFVLGLTGCASLGTYNAATGRREFIIIPTNEEVRMGQGMHQQILKQYPLSQRRDQVERINRIGRRLAQVSDRQDYQYHFFLIESKDINAFTSPGGHIYFFTGLLDNLTTDDHVAAVLGHEIGHCAARHTIKKFQAAVGYDIVGDIILGHIAKEEQLRRMATLSSNAMMKLVFSAYGRHDEYESDRLGIKYMDLAGFNLQGMLDVLEILNQKAERSQTPVILRTHPYAADRKTDAVKEIEKIKGP